jgi:uncharacterized protein (TIGR02453 family)
LRVCQFRHAREGDEATLAARTVRGMAFTGIPVEAVHFYEGLHADNSKVYWQANKSVYEQSVRAPFLALLDELAEYGPFQVFRPYKDVRFSKDKTPYKENIGAYGESEGGTGFYVAFSAAGMYAGSGYYMMASDQLERFRAAVDAEATGKKIAALVAQVEKAGLKAGAMSELKTAPRGVPKDHPRIELLRRKGLMAGRDFPLAKWVHTKAAVGKVRDAWLAAADMNAWLDAHVGPSTLPPEDWRR